MNEVERIVARLKRKDRPAPREELRLSSGSTLVNLACTDGVSHAYCSGCYYFFVGDSQSGKTYLTMAALAEASVNPAFDDYRLIYDDVEGGMRLDVEHHYGPRLAKRLEINTEFTSLEDYYARLDRDLDAGKPLVRVLDSMDALRPQAELDAARATSEGKDAKGSYGTDKAKINSQKLPGVVNKLRDTGSILFYISQTRDNIGFGAQFNPKTRSGGTALKFYATLELWTSIKETIRKRVNEQDREVGIRAQVRVKKSRESGRKLKVEVPILHGCGLDDTGGMIQWLLDEKHWSEERKRIAAPEFGFDGKLDALALKLEMEGRVDELRAITKAVWDRIEEGCRTERTPKYR